MAKTATIKPFSDLAITDYLAKQFDASPKSQKEIAQELGYTNPGILSMFKTGQTKLPLDKVPALAKALEVDAAFLFRMAILQYMPDAAEAVAQIFGDVVTANERRILKAIRKASKNSDPHPTPAQIERLTKMFAE